jgi:hypothetical protein
MVSVYKVPRMGSAPNAWSSSGFLSHNPAFRPTQEASEPAPTMSDDLYSDIIKDIERQGFDIKNVLKEIPGNRTAWRFIMASIGDFDLLVLMSIISV